MKCLLEERGKITFAIRNADSDSYIGYVSHYKGRWRVRNADCDEIAAALLEGTMRGCTSENDRPKADMNYLRRSPAAPDLAISRAICMTVRHASVSSP